MTYSSDCALSILVATIIISRLLTSLPPVYTFTLCVVVVPCCAWGAQAGILSLHTSTFVVASRCVNQIRATNSNCKTEHTDNDIPIVMLLCHR